MRHFRNSARKGLTSSALLQVAHQSQTSGCLVTSGFCWAQCCWWGVVFSKKAFHHSGSPTWYSELSTEMSALFDSVMHSSYTFVLPPAVPFIGPDGFCATTVEFPALRCSDRQVMTFHCYDCYISVGEALSIYHIDGCTSHTTYIC